MVQTCVSAGGKVLLAGGYLVLDPIYSGAVISTSSRFYTVIDPTGHPGSGIQVKSPQFLDATWNYNVAFEGTDRVAVSEAPNQRSANKFVQLALRETLRLSLEVKGMSFLSHALEGGLNITIVGGNDFYSQRNQLAALGLPPTLASLDKIPPFARSEGTLSNVHKTGLGSSAALITSLVAALLVHLEVIPASSLASSADFREEGRSLVHNTAQYVHCLAQGKVGSGFDVSSAVYGSHIYTRFDPVVIKPLMHDTANYAPLLPVLSPSNKAWDHKIRPFRLPPSLRLMLADVDAGSDTPSLVGKVLKWRADNAQKAKELWDTLGEVNGAFATALSGLANVHAKNPDAYNAAIALQIGLTNKERFGTAEDPVASEVAEYLRKIHATSETIRAKMRLMGQLSGVPIEPQEQTNILNACIEQAGVVAGGVPGAGGYDAIWILVIEPEGSHNEASKAGVDRVEQIWSNWKEMTVSPLAAVESQEKGARVENVEDVDGLTKALLEREASQLL